MNKFIIFAFAMATISMAAAMPSDSCTPQKTKPGFNDQPIDKDNLNDDHWKMFQGYIQEDQDGQSLFVPFNLVVVYDYSGEPMPEEETRPHFFDMTLKSACVDVDVDITRASKKELIYNFYGQQVTYHFGGATKTCKLTLLPSQDGHPTYGCDHAKLVVQRIDMGMFMNMDDDYVVSVN